MNELLNELRIRDGEDLLGYTFVAERKANPEQRIISFVGSTEDLDRHRTVLLMSGWDLDHFQRNPVILFGHDHSIPAIGKAEKVFKRDGALNFDVRFSEEEFADSIFRMVMGDLIRATSVGFIGRNWLFPNEDGKFEGIKKKVPDGTRAVSTEQELLELSIVNVGSNPKALKRAMGNMLAHGLIDHHDLEVVEEHLDKETMDVLGETWDTVRGITLIEEVVEEGESEEDELFYEDFEADWKDGREWSKVDRTVDPVLEEGLKKIQTRLQSGDEEREEQGVYDAIFKLRETVSKETEK